MVLVGALVDDDGLGHLIRAHNGAHARVADRVGLDNPATSALRARIVRHPLVGLDHVAGGLRDTNTWLVIFYILIDDKKLSITYHLVHRVLEELE